MRRRPLLGFGALLCLLLLLLLLLLGGWWVARPGHNITPEAVDEVRHGMTAAEVESLLGGPPGDFSGGAWVNYSPEAGPPQPGEWGGVRPAGEVELHAEEWVGPQAAVMVWFGPDGRAVTIARGRVIEVDASLLERARRRLGL